MDDDEREETENGRKEQGCVEKRMHVLMNEWDIVKFSRDAV